MLKRRLARGVLATLLMSCFCLPAAASNTGTLRGRVTDASTGAPIAGVTISVRAPQQFNATTTDASGQFVFISLSPDTYTVSAEKTGYEPSAQAGTVVYADQSIVVNIGMQPAIKTIAHVSSSGASSLVRSGTTSDVYSVNGSGLKATAAAAGAGSMNQAYAAISSVPGVNISTNQQGWYQNIYIRGGNIDQVAYEFDGLPTIRQSDLATITTLSTLGSQEVQVYTGGTPASSNSSGLAGYINQVVKTGTSPGYADAVFGFGTPTFYHSATVEASGATPDRLFSYYVGMAGTNQDFRYGDQFNGAGNPLYFYPLAIPTHNSTYNILDGSGAPNPQCPSSSFGACFSPGNSYAQAADFDRETVMNVHLGIPHHSSPLRDDVQLLYVTGGVNTQFYSSQYELGPNNVAAAYGSYPVNYLDSTYYTGALMQAPNQSKLAFAPFPSSTVTTPGAKIDPNVRDGSYNGYSIEKFQYQKSFNDRSYLRFIAYSELSNWFINGPVSAQLAFGAELADYEVDMHAAGGGLTYSNQVSNKHLLTAGLTYMTQHLETYNAQFSSTDPNANARPPSGLGTVLSSYIDGSGHCYNYRTGIQASCFGAGTQGGCVQPGGCYTGPQPGQFNLTPGTAPPGSPAALAGAHWVMTENGQSAQVDHVQPNFSSASLTDLWQPSDKLTLNLGVRLDQFAYQTQDLESGYPARQFWFTAYNREHCGTLGFAPVSVLSNGSCPAGYLPMTDPGNGLYDTGAASSVTNVFQPRVSGTWTLNPDTVIRASYGKYARAEASSYFQYNTFQQNLPSFLAQFYAYGYHTPDHNLQPDTSNNFDVSLEKHLKGTNMSFKVTPFYRNTQNQLQQLAIDPLGGTLAGLNVGTQKTYGVEFSFQGGDLSRNGLSYILSYTNTNSAITFHPYNGISVIQSLNGPIEQYNSYTKACAHVTARSPNWTACGSGLYAGNALPSYSNGVANPYYDQPLQSLLDPNGSYAPSNVIPSPFNGANSYEVPNVVSLVLNYRRNRFAFTPTLRWDDGASYGSPLVWPGYVPQACAHNPSLTPVTPGVSCGPGGAIFLPDPYNGNRFDNLDQFKDPSQAVLNLQTSYDVSNRISVTVSAVNVYNRCFQRGYAWDNPQTCTYSNLPSNILAPSGNFLKTNAAGIPLVAPVQTRYPYGTFFDITEVGASSVIQPFNLFVNVNVKI